MVDHLSSQNRLSELRGLIVEALRLSDELGLPAVAIRLEQARLMIDAGDD